MREMLDKAKAIEAQIIADRRHIHQNPEVGIELPKTVAYVKKRLTDMGIEARDCGKLDEVTRNKIIDLGYPEIEKATGLSATIGKGGPCILLRADMDALPMEEINELDFRAKGDKSHMCGHDSHVAMLLGAARLLKDMESELKGTVKLMFQPGEELGLGAKAMLDDGVLENPHVDAAVAIHIMPQTLTGKVTCAPGLASASLDSWIINIQGKGGHSSQPQDCIDPLMIMNQVYSGLNILVGRESNPKASVTLSCGFARGGTAANIIPDTAEMGVGMRAHNKEAREHLIKRVPEIISHYIEAWRGTYKLTVVNTPSTVGSPDFFNSISGFITEVMGEGNLEIVDPMAATEDFCYVSEKVPAALLFLGGGGTDAAPLHNSHFILDESVFVKGAAVYANIALEWLKNNK